MQVDQWLNDVLLLLEKFYANAGDLIQIYLRFREVWFDFSPASLCTDFSVCFYPQESFHNSLIMRIMGGSGGVKRKWANENKGFHDATSFHMVKTMQMDIVVILELGAFGKAFRWILL